MIETAELCAEVERGVRVAAQTRGYPSRSAPVAQWIEQRFPKPRAHVRFMPGASPHGEPGGQVILYLNVFTTGVRSVVWLLALDTAKTTIDSRLPFVPLGTVSVTVSVPLLNVWR